MEANKNKNLGNAGEFYVLAQLAQRGYIAGKTDDGQTLIDVIATEPDTLNTVNIQVKTRTIDGRISSWLMSFKNEKAFEKLWYVVVEVGDDDVLPNFFVFSSKEVSDAIEAALKARKKWSNMSWEHRASIFLKAADLLAGPFRAKMNASTMIAQSKNVFQAEIDAACELIDFLKSSLLLLITSLVLIKLNGAIVVFESYILGVTPAPIYSS